MSVEDWKAASFTGAAAPLTGGGGKARKGAAARKGGGGKARKGASEPPAGSLAALMLCVTGTIVAKWANVKWVATKAQEIELDPGMLFFAMAGCFIPREEVVAGRDSYRFLPVKNNTAVFVPDGVMIGVLVPSGDQTLLVLVPMAAIKVSCLLEAVGTFKPNAWPVKETDERVTCGLFRCIAELLAGTEELESTRTPAAAAKAKALLGKLEPKVAGYQTAAPALYPEVLALYHQAEERIRAAEPEQERAMEAMGANAPDAAEVTPSRIFDWPQFSWKGKLDCCWTATVQQWQNFQEWVEAGSPEHPKSART